MPVPVFDFKHKYMSLRPDSACHTVEAHAIQVMQIRNQLRFLFYPDCILFSLTRHRAIRTTFLSRLSNEQKKKSQKNRTLADGTHDGNVE